jgi:hypothetical protein
MSSMTLYGLSGDWDETAYQALLGAAEIRGGHCVLVQRRWASEACLDWIQKRVPDLESKSETKQWPGTIVHDEADAATLFKYRVTPEMLVALRNAAASENILYSRRRICDDVDNTHGLLSR